MVYAIGNQKLRSEAGIPGEADGPKRDRLERIRNAHTDHDKYIVVDDQDLSGVHGWDYYTPEQFMEEESE